MERSEFCHRKWAFARHGENIWASGRNVLEALKVLFDILRHGRDLARALAIILVKGKTIAVFGVPVGAADTQICKCCEKVIGVILVAVFDGEVIEV